MGIQVQLVDLRGDPRKPCVGLGQCGGEGQEAVKAVLSESQCGQRVVNPTGEMQKTTHSACLESPCKGGQLGYLSTNSCLSG